MMPKVDKNLSPLNKRVSGIFLVIFASICWGTSGIFIFNIVEKGGLSAVGLAFWRDLISSLVLLAGLLVINPKLLRVKKEDLPFLIGMGVISIGIFHIFWNIAVLRLGTSLATVIQCNAPVFVTILARILFKEELSFRKIAAIGAAAAGTILAAGMIGRWDLQVDSPAVWIGLGSAFTYATLSLFGKKLVGEYSSWTITFYIFMIGTLTIFLFQGGRPEPWPIGSGILPWMLGFVLMSTILGFGLYTKALTLLPASVAAIIATAEILSASIFSAIFLGDRLGIWQIVGAVLIIIGVVLVSLKKSNIGLENI
jgi:drug/metabolite transporter (DMT)-like permease